MSRCLKCERQWDKEEDIAASKSSLSSINFRFASKIVAGRAAHKRDLITPIAIESIPSFEDLVHHSTERRDQAMAILQRVNVLLVL